MAKRFIDTEIFSDEWFSELSMEGKLFFIYYITNCDHAGVLHLNKKLCEFQIGIKNIEIVIKELGNCLVTLKEGLLFMPKFLTFQYPDFPKSKVRQQEGALKILQNLGVSLENINSYIRVSKELSNSYVHVHGNDNVTGTDTDTGIGTGTGTGKKESKEINNSHIAEKVFSADSQISSSSQTAEPIREKKETPLYKKMVDYYFEWYEKKFRMKPDFDGSDGRALKSIITYFGSQPDNAGDEKIYVTWTTLLSNFNKWDKFHQTHTRVRQINAVKSNLINYLKNGKPGEVTDESLAEALREDFRKRGIAYF